jgi:hypothetical protein
MERPGRIHPNAFHLCLGNYELKHTAYFNGLLDEVRIYDRALTAAQVQEQYRKLADRTSAAPPTRKRKR